MSSGAKVNPTAARFCHLCGKPLRGRYYIYETGLICCDTCQRDRPRCARCGVPLDDAALARQRASGGSQPLCAHCAREAPRCSSCGRAIIGTYHTFEELGPEPPRKFCGDCVRSRPRCDLCRAPVPQGMRPLPDGQYRCAVCARDLVLDDATVRKVYEQALATMQQVLGERLRQIPRLEVTDRRHLAQVRRRFARQGGGDDDGAHHVLGFFVRVGNDLAIYVERALPRSLLLGTLAHELGHALQAETAPWVHDPALCEGFAEWVAHRVLVSRGLQVEAARATRRDDLYGRSLRTMLDIERRKGVSGVLAAARGKGT